MEKITIRFITFISRYVLAVVFIFSGFVKGIDPLGLTYKLIDYFTAFKIGFLEPLALPMAFALCAAELLIGLLLFFKVGNRLAIWGVFIFMLIFTPLTFISAIFNPVSDCGCFGDAIILTNWETFFKNIFFLAAATMLLMKRKSAEHKSYGKHEWAIVAILGIISFLPPIHGYRNLPLIDFRPYAIGTNIFDGMSKPLDAPVDVYKTTLIYEKDGVVKEFTEENFPWQDSTWKFVDSKSVLVKKGYSPPIIDFVLTSTDGWNKTDSILSFPGYFFLAVSYRLETANPRAIDRLNQLYYKVRGQNMGFACITASPEAEIDKFISKTGAAFPFLQADEIMLKTTIRSNPGLILLKSGTIIGKWHYNNCPDPTLFEGNIDAKLIKQKQITIKYLWTGILVLAVVLLQIAIWIGYKKRVSSNA